MFPEKEIGSILNPRVTGVKSNERSLEIIIKPHNLMESGQKQLFLEKQEVEERKPSFTYVEFFTIRPEMAKNLALFGRPFRRPRGGNGRKSLAKGKSNKYRKSQIIPALFQF